MHHYFTICHILKIYAQVQIDDRKVVRLLAKVSRKCIANSFPSHQMKNKKILKRHRKIQSVWAHANQLHSLHILTSGVQCCLAMLLVIKPQRIRSSSLWRCCLLYICQFCKSISWFVSMPLLGLHPPTYIQQFLSAIEYRVEDIKHTFMQGRKMAWMVC